MYNNINRNPSIAWAKLNNCPNMAFGYVFWRYIFGCCKGSPYACIVYNELSFFNSRCFTLLYRH